MKKIFIVSLLLATSVVFSQKLNNYKYAVVPSKFSFLSSKNEYRLNEFTKMLMEKHGFETYYDADALPKDLTPFNTVYVNLENSSTVFTTKLKMILNDASGKPLYTSKEASSREKDYSKAYYAVLNDISLSLETLNHNYVAQPEVTKIEKTDETKSSETKYAVAKPFSSLKIENGYKLFNGEDAGAQFIIYETSNPNIFIAKKTDSSNENGVLIHKSNDLYSFEFYKDGKLIKENINILF